MAGAARYDALLRDTAVALTAAGIDNARFEARLLLGEANGYNIGTVAGCVSCTLAAVPLTGITVGSSAGNLVDGTAGFPVNGNQIVLNTLTGDVTQDDGAFVVTSEFLLRGNANYNLGKLPTAAAIGNDEVIFFRSETFQSEPAKSSQPALVEKRRTSGRPEN